MGSGSREGEFWWVDGWACWYSPTIIYLQLALLLQVIQNEDSKSHTKGKDYSHDTSSATWPNFLGSPGGWAFLEPRDQGREGEGEKEKERGRGRAREFRESEKWAKIRESYPEAVPSPNPFHLPCSSLPYHTPVWERLS